MKLLHTLTLAGILLLLYLLMLLANDANARLFRLERSFALAPCERTWTGTVCR